jgi:arylsulfatase A
MTGAVALGPSGTKAAATGPNIIYILADDLGYGDLGCYGQKDIMTPHIDQLAREGVKFTQHYSGSTVCAPARCVLMTGLHTGHCHVRGNLEIKPEGQTPIPADSVTIPKLLKKAGYTSGCIGKWGLGFPGSEGEPTKQGFDFFFGYNCQRHAHGYYPEYLWRNNEKIALEGNKDGAQNQYSHDLMADESLDFIRRNKDNPFFLYVPFTIPHTRFQVPDLGVYADKDWDENHKIQASMITRMDKDVGRIMALLHELRIDKNTLVMFASDNGAHGQGGTGTKFTASGPLRGIKRDLYEGGIRVPFIARWTGKITPGTKTDLISGFQDMMPTFIELAHAPNPPRTDGISLVPTLLGTNGQKQHEYMYWEFYEKGGKRAVRWGDWKGVRVNLAADPNAPVELYNLSNDLSEQNNIANDHPAIVARILKIMEEAHTPSELFKYKPKKR